jgi:hypothetical protein
MDGFSILDPLAWDATGFKLHPAYAVGNAAGWLSKTGAAATTNHYLAGRLYVSKSGWLLLSVPNALVRGVFDAMTAPGAELPLAGALNVPDVKPDLLNAHISVMTADEVSKIGANKINERGHNFHYALGPVKELAPKNIDGISRVWAIQVASPELAALRKSYGLSALPNGDHQFHITVAVRRAKVLGNNNVSKFDSATSRGELKAAAEKVLDVLPGGQADHVPDEQFPPEALAEGKKHEREHTNNAEVAKEIAKDHLSEEPAYYKKIQQLEKDGGSVYLDQGRQMLDPLAIQKPIPYDPSKPVFENIKSQLTEAKRRGDFIRDSDRNHKMWRAQLDPRYRHQLALKAIRGQTERPNLIDQVIARYGDDVLAQFSPGRK